MQWLTSTDPEAMLEFLRNAGDPSERRCRLFACACVRRISPLAGPASLDAVAVAEQFADGRATEDELVAARRGAGPVAATRLRGHAVAVVWAASYCCAHWAGHSPNLPYKPGWLAAVRASGHARDAVVRKAASDAQKSAGNALAVMRAARDAEVHAQAALLRDIFGDPCRSRPSVEAAWLALHDGTVKKLAEAIYVERAFERMPLLADALEDAGCTDKDILAHCREPRGVHVRGCYIIDLLLGKK